MPIYEYHCDACDKTYEVNQRMSDEPLSACACGAKGQIHRLMSAGAGFIFKGAGFYQTDYKGGGKPPEAAPEAKPAPAATGHSCASGGCGCAPKT